MKETQGTKSNGSAATLESRTFSVKAHRDPLNPRDWAYTIYLDGRYVESSGSWLEEGEALAAGTERMKVLDANANRHAPKPKECPSLESRTFQGVQVEFTTTGWHSPIGSKPPFRWSWQIVTVDGKSFTSGCTFATEAEAKADLNQSLDPKPKESPADAVTVRGLINGDAPDIYVTKSQSAWVTFPDGSNVHLFFGKAYRHVILYPMGDNEEIEVDAYFSKSHSGVWLKGTDEAETVAEPKRVAEPEDDPSVVKRCYSCRHNHGRYKKDGTKICFECTDRSKWEPKKAKKESSADER